MWILISWLLKKSSDLDLHCFKKEFYRHSDLIGQMLTLVVLVKLRCNFLFSLGACLIAGLHLLPWIHILNGTG